MNTEQFESILTESCAEVLETMCFASIIGAEEAGTTADTNRIYSRLSFKGVLHGHFGISAPAVTSNSLAAAFLGLDEDSVTTAQSEQVLCELANMICGAVLSRMDSGAIFELSHPEIVTCYTASAEWPETAAKNLQLDRGSIALWLNVSRN
jgi:hypothetical protein